MNGIVIKQADTVTGDRIVWIFTEEYGIIKASGRGALKAKGKNGAGTQLLTYGDFEIYTGRETGTVTGCEAKEVFSGIHSDLYKLALASYFCEVVYRHIGLSNPDVNVFRLLVNSLYALSYMDIPLACVKAVFEARFVCEIGYMPYLDGCLNCGVNNSKMYFSCEKGGILCGNCMTIGDIPMSLSAVNAWRYISESTLKRLFSFEASDECITDLANITERYLMYHTDSEIKSLEYYKKIKRG